MITRSRVTLLLAHASPPGHNAGMLFSVSRISRWLLACVAVIAMASLVVFLSRPSDDFRRKYDRIKPEMSVSEVSEILGPSDRVMRPGGSLGETIHFWKDNKGRIIKVTWPLFRHGSSVKELIAWPPPAWWENPLDWWSRTPANPKPSNQTAMPPLPRRD